MSKKIPTGNKLTFLGRLHRILVSRSRAEKLAMHLAPIFERDSSVLDVGCGYGLVSQNIRNLRPDISLSGIDIIVRDDCLIDAKIFDGSRFPFEEDEVDYVVFIDVLHHTNYPENLLREAARIARKGVVVKDHQAEGFLAWKTLWFLDWAGNRPYDIGLTYNYWSRAQWLEAFEKIGLHEVACTTKLDMYPFPFSLFFNRSLHFIGKLAVPEKVT